MEEVKNGGEEKRDIVLLINEVLFMLKESIVFSLLDIVFYQFI